MDESDTTLNSQDEISQTELEFDPLGFIPQKEFVFNKYLPYAEKIDGESNIFLAEIKENLALSVQLRDLKRGTRHWIVQLERYIYVYGYKFSKTDHVLLVQLIFDLLTMPSKEYNLTEKLALTMTLLLKKRDLLTRDDLVLPWKPLYAIVEDWSKEGTGCKVFPPFKNMCHLRTGKTDKSDPRIFKFENHLKNTIRACSYFFYEDATAEILEMFRPFLCPFDMLVIGGLQGLDIFLPTALPPELHHKGFKLWFDDLMNLWKSFHSMPSWEGSLVNLFGRLAHNNVGYIDWTPHLPMIFTRLLRSFNLPVGAKQLASHSRIHSTYDIVSVSTLIVGMMGGPNDEVQEHVTKLFKALHSFYHPSNIGRWNLRLGSFLQNLPKQFVYRIRRERHKELKWLPPVPESHKLSDEHITEFVESLKSSVFVAMFGKFGSQDASSCLRHLASLRPEIIMPPLLEKMYPAMETLIEPHRLISCMVCIVSVARPMLSSPSRYPEGPSHILPLLNLALPGIDANDFKKTLVTLQMVSTFVSLVPLVDSSDAIHVRNDLTEHEKDLCSATAQFEDFILCFLDRVQNLIESSSEEVSFGAAERLTIEQSVVEVGLASTVSAMLQQCSTPIYMSALQKIHRFVTGNVYEVKVSGKLAANLCRSAIRIKPEVGLKMFIPHFCSNIQSFLSDHPGAYEEEHLNDQFLWDLLMLSYAVRCDGSKLLPYVPDIIDVLKKTLVLKCVQAYELASQLMKNLLKFLTQMYPKEFKSVNKDLDLPVSEYLPIRDWGIPGDIDDLDLEWHIPTDEEISLAGQILETFLAPELDFFKNIGPDNETSKEDVLRRLHIISEAITGSATQLREWDGEQVKVVESQVPLTRFACSISSEKTEILLGGRNVRESVHEAMSHLLTYLNQHREDDTKSVFQIIKIYELLMSNFGTVKNDLESRWKSFQAVKNALSSILTGKKRHIRALLVDRLQLQHEIRMLNYSTNNFTERHNKMTQELLSLSVGRYREVRKKAQSCLSLSFRTFMFSFYTCIPQITSHLQNKDVEQHVFKGSLYVIHGGANCLATRRSWQALSEIWPAVVQAQQFEKPSILRVVDDIVNKIFKSLDTFAVTINTTDTVISTAGNLLTSCSHPRPASGPASPTQLQEGVTFEEHINAQNLLYHSTLVEKLLGHLDSGTLNWKFSQIGFEFLGLVLHDDIPPSAPVVSIFVKNCNNDLLYIRKLCISALTSVLDLQKQRFKKVAIDLEAVAGVGAIDNDSLLPGDRPDNRWLQYDPDNFISTEEEWNQTTFIEKTHWGYYCWPKELKALAPPSEQPKIDRSREELSPAEIPIYDSFLQEAYVAKFFEFTSLEEDKNTDKFRLHMLKFYKSLCRNFGPIFVPLLRPHIERLASDTSHDKHSSSQRCAMEALAGIIAGSKYWTFQQLNDLWSWVTPLLAQCLNNLTVETLGDWGNFFLYICENRAPQKLQWLYRMLLQNPLSGEGGAFGDSARLYVLQQAILQQEWRIPGVLNKVVKTLSPSLNHNYKSVRDRIALLFSSCMHMDFDINSKSQTLSPRRAELISLVLPQLKTFHELAAENTTATASSDEPMEVDSTNGESEERKALIRLCKTVVTWLSTCIQRSLRPCIKEIYSLIPIIEEIQSEANDEDLRNDCKILILHLSSVLIPEDVIETAFSTIKEVTVLRSWHARASILNSLQQIVFGNFFQLQHPDQKSDLQTLLLNLLCDEQLEVREMAAVTLSGMIHCGYLDLNQDMLQHFKVMRSTKVAKSKRAKLSEAESLPSLVQRHAGVLGLSACVSAYPYDVPKFIPQVLVDLSDHVNDPQPIGSTVTKTLNNFRRTHHDNWQDHKQMFTDDQLVTLTDLLISPNYYA